MVTTAQKKERSKLLDKFVRDFTRLRLEYDLRAISTRTGIDSTNLSSYGSGKKTPGLKVLAQFYKAFAGEIQNPLDEYNPDPPHELKIEEARVFYHHDETAIKKEFIETLKQENNRLLESLKKSIATNEKLLTSNENLIKANENLVQSTAMMAETNRKLVDKLIGKSVS